MPFFVRISVTETALCPPGMGLACIIMTDGKKKIIETKDKGKIGDGSVKWKILLLEALMYL